LLEITALQIHHEQTASERSPVSSSMTVQDHTTSTAERGRDLTKHLVKIPFAVGPKPNIEQHRLAATTPHAGLHNVRNLFIFAGDNQRRLGKRF
jgi:hypothetical protein